MGKKISGIIEVILIFIMIIMCYLFDRSEIRLIIILMSIMLLIVAQVISIFEKNKKRNSENMFDSNLEELQKIENKTEIPVQNEDTIKRQIEEIKTAKKEIKEIEFDKTVQIPLEDIQNQINNINKKLIKEDKSEKVGDDTVVLFSKDDIKEVIKKELESTKTVDKEKKNSKKTTKSVENNENNKKESTKPVDKSKTNVKK